MYTHTHTHAHPMIELSSATLALADEIFSLHYLSSVDSLLTSLSVAGTHHSFGLKTRYIREHVCRNEYG